MYVWKLVYHFMGKTLLEHRRILYFSSRLVHLLFTTITPLDLTCS